MLPVLAGVMLPAVGAGIGLIKSGLAVTRVVNMVTGGGVADGSDEDAAVVVYEEVADPYAPMRGEADVALFLSERENRDVKVHLGCLLDTNRNHPELGADKLIGKSDQAAQLLGALPYKELLARDRANRRERWPEGR